MFKRITKHFIAAAAVCIFIFIIFLNIIVLTVEKSTAVVYAVSCLMLICC